MNAARNGYANTLSLLLRDATPKQRHLALDAQDEAGETALYKAAAVGHVSARPASRVFAHHPPDYDLQISTPARLCSRFSVKMCK